MIWKSYELESTISKAAENVTLWRTERGIVEIEKDTLAVPIRLGDHREGYVFHGKAKLLLDTIVETEEGAVGKPVEKEVSEPLLMLGDAEGIQQHLMSVNKEDLARLGYENQEEFLAKGERLLDRFSRGRRHCSGHLGRDHGSIFAFPSEAGELDILLAKDSKLVYKASDMVFVSNDSEVVLKSSSNVIVTHNGKSLVIKR